MYTKNISRGPQKSASDQAIVKSDQRSIGTLQKSGDARPRHAFAKRSVATSSSIKAPMQQAACCFQVHRVILSSVGT